MSAARRQSWALTLCGGVLLLGGPTAPMLWGGSTQGVLLLSLGRQGGTTVRLAPQAQHAGWVHTVLAPGVVELRAPANALLELEAFGKLWVLAAHALPPCAAPQCAQEALAGVGLYAQDAEPLDPPALQSVTAPRWAWLLGMAAGLLGLALLVLSKTFLQVAIPRRAAMLAGALTLGPLGAGLAWTQSGALHQEFIIKPAQVPRLASQPPTQDVLENTHNVVARVQSPGFTAGLTVGVHAMAMGNGLLAHVSTPPGDAVLAQGSLDAWAKRVEERILRPQRRSTAETRLLLEALPSESSLRMLAELQEPMLEALPVTADPRTPLATALLTGLAGALLGFALGGSRERQNVAA